ncbi:hypothetical protein QBC36DRAFT_291004 [Triangularia setosa]|uniref:Uncharacterized protein n=1 Tax=Triangularia setosa TaxID=2587417 RepID=A0AAN6W7P7_9PEZI|nr:hypothetical protein QBC36DRAFT_291004 [Podospora setosa]
MADLSLSNLLLLFRRSSQPIVCIAENETITNDVVEIFTLVTELDLILHSSEAEFQVFITNYTLSEKPRHFWFPYNSAFMDYTHLLRPLSDIYNVDKSVIVDVAISPGIIKCGTTDGRKYDNAIILIRLEALCSLLPAYDGLKVPEQLISQRHKSGRTRHSIKKEDTDDWRNEGVDMLVLPSLK